MIRQISPRDLAVTIANGHPIHLIDVRQPEEHAYAALEQSVLIPLPVLSERVNSLDIPMDAYVVVYCHHGIRSQTGAAIFQQAGFTNVVSLAGGIDAWSCQVDPAIPRY